MAAKNPELEAVWGAEPHLENIKLARARISEYRDSREAPADVGAVTRDVVDALLAGEPVPKDLPKRIKAAMDAEAVYQRETAVLLNVARSVENSDDRVRARAAHAGLARLHDRVVEIVAAAGEAQEVLGGVSSAEAALESGAEATEAWRSLVRLASQYRQVRDAQRTLVTATGKRGLQGGLLETLSTVGEFRDYDGLWPRHQRKDPTGGVFSARRDAPSWVAAPPWPHEADGSATRGPEFLLWAAAQDDNPLWVPSAEELLEARERASGAWAAAPTPEEVANVKKGEARARSSARRVREGFGPGQGEQLTR